MAANVSLAWEIVDELLMGLWALPLVSGVAELQEQGVGQLFNDHLQAACSLGFDNFLRGKGHVSHCIFATYSFSIETFQP
ncbi:MULTISPECIES: hypothetical protein [unclassified Pseudomonas]|uniref:hypothetical protein n=1 Tax=unclassified Pseudomonas TaxID=196821 RepID=UPI0015A89C65|nr:MULTISPECIES: hypothetical protein [unclassified Pseudomonas]MBS3185076.1 hypothetical protein [Pseudomonas sp. PCH44]